MNVRIKCIVCLLAAIMVVQRVSAQEFADSISFRNYSFEWKQTILPASLVAVGAVAIAPSFIQSGSHAVSDAFTDFRGNHSRITIDDQLQYLPMAGSLLVGCFGVDARHTFVERALITATSYVTLGVLTKGLKICVDETRPEFDTDDSFPSGHAARAFMGAELARIEYGNWYGLGAYTIATGVGLLRMYNGRHWFHDVVAGAGIGILSARVGEWSCSLWQKLLKRHQKHSADMVFSPIAAPFGGGFYGFSLACCF